MEEKAHGIILRTRPLTETSLIASATGMSSFRTLDSGTMTRNPEVGFGVVGMKTLTSRMPVTRLNSAGASPVTKPTAKWPDCGNSTSTACLNELFFSLAKASFTCFTVP